MIKKIDTDSFRKILMFMKKNLETRLTGTQSHLRHEKGPDSSDFAEQATERENDEVVAELDAMGKTELENINTALSRINDGSYGICKSCARPISVERLRSIPYTDLCKECSAGKQPD